VVQRRRRPSRLVALEGLPDDLGEVTRSPARCVTGPVTFSAAAEFADAVQTYQLATIVGEEIGGRPNDVGNSLPFVLPNSRLTVYIATVSCAHTATPPIGMQLFLTS
jgi:hypothetical protein